MESSILEDVRETCNLDRKETAFEGQLIQLINSFLFRSAQFGVGNKGFMIDSEDQTWDQFLSGKSADQYSALKTYIGLSVRLLFDPPDSSAVITAYKEIVKELEWCLYDEADVHQYAAYTETTKEKELEWDLYDEGFYE